MNIEKAMICLSIQLEVKHRLGKDYEAKALQLGIEALKEILLLREYLHIPHLSQLPWETKD